MNLPKGEITVDGGRVVLTRSTDSDEEQSKAFHDVCCYLSRHMLPGGYAALTLKHGNKLAALETKLAEKWSVEQIKKYGKTIETQLKHLGYWR